MTDLSAFPADFAWGTATAAYQIEGATQTDGRGPSIWDTFARKPGAIHDGSTGDVAVDHYHRYPEDVRIMSELGMNAYRFSIAWSRVLPTGTGPINPAGVDFYRRLSEDLLRHGITPFVTLYHWDLPQPLEDRGGWLERDTAYRFADYAATVQGALGDLVKHWITLNEPWCSSFVGYAAGDHAPGLTLGSRSARAAHHLLLGHGLAIDALRADPEASLGITLNLYSVQPASDSPADRDAARRIDGLHNRIFLDPVLTGQYPADVLTDLGEEEWFAANPPEDLAQIARPLDFLGINYYSRHTVAAQAPVGGAPTAAHRETGRVYPGSEHLWKVDTGGPRTHMGPICPEGLLDVLELANGMAPHLDLYITENGAPFDDTVEPDGTIQDLGRIDYFERHVDACAEAIARGIPLRGYFVWSLMDNFEWAWGYSRRFGLVYVDFATQARTIKASGHWFRSFLEPPATQAT